MSNKAIIYLRVSTDMQTEESQLEQCKKLCDKEGYVVVDVIRDHSRSAWKNVKRPGYDKAILMIKKKEASHIVVWALDRWTRKGPKELRSVVDFLSMHGAQIHSVQEKWLESINIRGTLGTVVKDFLFGLVAWMAQEESRLKSERIMASKKYQKAKKKGTVGRNKLPDEVVKEVLKKLEEKKSYRQIHDEVSYKIKHGRVKHISVGKVAEIANLCSKNVNKDLTTKKHTESL